MTNYMYTELEQLTEEQIIGKNYNYNMLVSLQLCLYLYHADINCIL